jgi:exodeoxyribonuclease VII small subunit
MATRNSESKKQEPTFETSLDRLETIVGEMESDQLSLEDLIGRYEEGVRLVKFCGDKLAAAEKRIEIILRNAEGKTELQPFDPETAPPAPPPARPERSRPADTGEARLF